MTVDAEEKETNIKKVLALYDEAVEQGGKILCSPEYFLMFPPHNDMTDEYVRGGGTDTRTKPHRLREKAKATKTYCVAGSIIELTSDGKLYNVYRIGHSRPSGRSDVDYQLRRIGFCSLKSMNHW